MGETPITDGCTGMRQGPQPVAIIPFGYAFIIKDECVNQRAKYLKKTECFVKIMRTRDPDLRSNTKGTEMKLTLVATCMFGLE